MYKVSPTLLDNYRSVCGQTQFPKEPEELIAYMKGEFKSTPSMDFGSLVHKYLETGDCPGLHEEEKNQLFYLYEKFKDASKEVYQRYQLTKDIVVSLKADAVLGNIVNEFKTGSKYWGYDLFANSYQWRIYSLAYDAPAVDYYHFEYGNLEKRPVKFVIRTFRLYPYEGMKDDIVDLAIDFIEWSKRNKIDHLILL